MHAWWRPLRVPQTPLPPKREEVRGPAYDKAAHASPSGLGGSVPLQVPQTPLPPKRREVRGPAYDMAAQATPSGRMWVFLLMERAA